MNKLNINVIALALGFAFSAGAMAEGISKSDYNAGKARIAAVYNSPRRHVKSLPGIANHICVAEANGKEKIARA